MKISVIPAEYVPQVWLEVKPLLERVVPYTGGRYDIGAILEDLVSERQLLWIAYKEAEGQECPEIHAAFTTRFVDYPRSRGLSCQFCGGAEIDEWINEADVILNRFAADNLCTFIELTGRNGWLRKLPESWSPEFRVYRRQVSSHGLTRPPSATTH